MLIFFHVVYFILFYVFDKYTRIKSLYTSVYTVTITSHPYIILIIQRIKLIFITFDIQKD